jgi:hypothetical protein
MLSKRFGEARLSCKSTTPPPPHTHTLQCVHLHVQGSLRAYIPPNSGRQPGPRAMERGDVGWAGAGPGPDWFVYLGRQPAAHWGVSHTVWGQIADEASMAVVERIVSQPATAPRPGDMHMLNTRVEFEVGASRESV